jgi:Domain of unknown function (DUF4157)
MFQTQTRQPSSSPGFSPPVSRPRLQRKCACGGTPGPSGECAECKRKRLSLQPKLAVNQPGDQYEQEADRVAEAVVGGAISSRPSISSLGNGSAVQREEPAKPKTEEEKYTEAAKKVGEAFLETAPGKEIKKKAEELGDAFISALPGKVITGAAVAGAVATLAATHKELPIGIPEIPLDKIKPGLKMKITYEGPVDKPTKVMATFSFSLAGSGKSSEKKSKLTESEKFRAETARMATEQAKFREGLKTPEEKAAEKRMFDAYLRSKMLGPQQLTPHTSPLSFGVAGEQLGFKPGLPPATERSPLGPLAPDFELTGEASAGERPIQETPKKKEDETLQRKAAGDQEISTAPTIVDEVLQSSGQPLDGATRAFMEQRFGHDFARVRVHRDARAAESARAVNALAYTVGQDVVFAAGRYVPGTSEGRQLLAHELTHTVQQRHGAAEKISPSLSVSLAAVAPAAFEHEADQIARLVIGDDQPVGPCVPSLTTGRVVARQAQAEREVPLPENGVFFNGSYLLIRQSGKTVVRARAVSGMRPSQEWEKEKGPIPDGTYSISPHVIMPPVNKIQTPGVFGAAGIDQGYQKVTNTEQLPCVGHLLGNVHCVDKCPPDEFPPDEFPDWMCTTPVAVWGKERVKIEGSATLKMPGGGKVTRDGFFIHGGDTRVEVTSGCIKVLEPDPVFAALRKFTQRVPLLVAKVTAPESK